MKNIVLFGGAFNPIHYGHLNMAFQASKELDADVIFIPARISVWKNESASVEDKINMIDIAIKSFKGGDRFFISTYEADSKQDINYSIDTVKHFKEEYKEANLFLLIGTDQVNSFEKWKSADEIASLAKIVYFSRPGLELRAENIERFKMRNIPGEMLDISSTEIREIKSLKTPVEVVDYIIEHNLYFINKIKSYLSEKRFIHSVSVAKLAYGIAVENKVNDPDKYLIAGLLHDIGKYVSHDETMSLMNEYFSEYLNLEPMIYHQFIGKYKVEKDFDIHDEDILTAIEFHTTGNSGMSDLAKVIYCADKIEPNRGFDSTDLIKAMKVNIDSGFIEVLKANIEYFDEHHINYKNPLTNVCIATYLK